MKTSSPLVSFIEPEASAPAREKPRLACLPASVRPATAADSVSSGAAAGAGTVPGTEPAGRGRPGIYTPEVGMKIFSLIQDYGLSDSHAGLLAGVSTSTLSRWKEGLDDFRDLLETARAEFELKRLQVLLKATRANGTVDWRTQVWLLERSARNGAVRKPGRPRKENGVAESRSSESRDERMHRAHAPAREPAIQRRIPENAAARRFGASIGGAGQPKPQKFPEKSALPADGPARNADAQGEKIPEIGVLRPEDLERLPEALTQRIPEKRIANGPGAAEERGDSGNAEQKDSRNLGADGGSGQDRLPRR